MLVRVSRRSPCLPSPSTKHICPVSEVIEALRTFARRIPFRLDQGRKMGPESRYRAQRPGIGDQRAVLGGKWSGDWITGDRPEIARRKRLASDLSTLSKTQEGSYRLDLHPVDLGAVLRDVVDLLGQQVDAAGVQLQMDTVSPVTVHADADRLAQILINVIGNSLAYTTSGGIVTVSLSSEGVNAVVRVTDTGLGLSAADLVRVFERFYRVDDQASPSTGVGLTIARSLARAHGGDIAASSPGLGKGATFEVMLPLG